MRKTFIVLTGLLGVLLLSEGLRREVQAAGPTPAVMKIGYIDLQSTLEKTKKGGAAKAKLEADKAKKQKEIDKKKKDLEAAAKELEKKRGVLKPEVALQQQQQLEKDFIALQQQFAQFQQDLLKAEQALTQAIFKDAAKIIESIAKRDGFTMIVEKNEGAVLYADKSLDITDEVNRRMDAGEAGK
jgi:outer membrane protein